MTAKFNQGCEHSLYTKTVVAALQDFHLSEDPKAENDAFFAEKVEASSKMTSSSTLKALNELIAEERKKTSHCLSRIAYDRTRAQMMLITLKGELKKTKDLTGNTDLLQDIETHEAFIKDCEEQIQVIKARILRLEKLLKDVLLSCSAENPPQHIAPVLSRKEITVSQNQCGFWGQKEKSGSVDKQTSSIPGMEFSR